MTKILNQAAAADVFAVMLAAKKLGARVAIDIPNGGGSSTRVSEFGDGRVRVSTEYPGEAHAKPWTEMYDSRTHFALSYGVSST